MTPREQLAGGVEVLVGERKDLGPRHAGADDSVRPMSPKTVTGVELELDDGPVRDAELFLVDGNNLAYRGFFALPEELQTTDGQPTNALLGFTNMLFKLLSDYRPRGVAVAWDTRPVHRTEIAETYKEGRRPMPDLLREQFPHFRPIVEAFGYRNLEFEGWEADDVIATLATRADEAGIKTCVVSTDRDAFQLCSENVSLMMTPRGVADVNVYTPERVELRYGVRPDQVPDFIGLKGDTSDNIPGIPGIGDKTAGQLIAQYGSLESVIEHAGELSPARSKAVTEHADQARDSKLLATMQRDLPLDVDPGELVSAPPDRSQLKEIFRRFEFRGLLGRVDTLDEALPAAELRLVQDTVPLEGVGARHDPWRGSAVAWDGERVAIARPDGAVLVARGRTGRSRGRGPRGPRSSRTTPSPFASVAPRPTTRCSRRTSSIRVVPGTSSTTSRQSTASSSCPSRRRRRRPRRSSATPKPRGGWRRSCARRCASAAQSRSTTRSSFRSRPCSPRWRTPASGSTPTAWERSRRGSPIAWRSSRRRPSSSPASRSSSARRRRWRASCSRCSA